MRFQLTKLEVLQRWFRLEDVPSAVDSGWESDYKSDLDGNGLIVEVHPTNFHHQLVLLNLPIKKE